MAFQTDGAVGLIGLTRTLAREGTKYDIKTNVIVPVSSQPP